MIIHSVINAMDIFYAKSSEQVMKTEAFSTDPYYFLNKDKYYQKYVQGQKK